MTKENTLNEKEVQVAVKAKLDEAGIEITATDINYVYDALNDVKREALIAGHGIKVRGIGTLEVRPHNEKTYSVPDTKNDDGTWNMKSVVSPAGLHVRLEMSDTLKGDMNA